jgi:hypothetical protein
MLLQPTSHFQVRLSFHRPGNLPAVVVRQIGDMPSARSSYSRLHRSVRLLARPDAIEKVLHVSDGAVAKTFGAHHWILFPSHAFVIHAESAAIDLQRRVRPAELQPAIINRSRHHPLSRPHRSRIAAQRRVR